MVKKFSEIKQYVYAMGFKNQKEFRKHVELKRAERLEYKKKGSEIDTYYSLKPKERSVVRDEKVSDTLNMFARAVGIWTNKISQSVHAWTVHSQHLVLRYPKRWKYRNNGYYDISFYRVKDRIILITFFRGKTHRFETKLPANWKRFTTNHYGLLKHEIGILTLEEIVVRYQYDSNSNSFQKTGVSVELDNPSNPGEKYWEHGETVRDCIRERENKLETQLYWKKIQDQNEKSKRKQRLVSRLCNRVRITFQDALDSGNCLAGVSNFVKSNFPEKMPVIDNNSFVNNKYITLGELKGMGSSSYTQRVVDYVCMMVAQLTV